MRIAISQMNIAEENRAANLRTVAMAADQAEEKGADMLVLPEMFTTGFSMNSAVTTEPKNGETVQFLRNVAREHRLGIIAGLVISDNGDKPRNVAITLDRNGEELALYAKTHLFSLMEEDRHHAAGDGPSPFAFEGMGASCFICYDLRFPELFRMVADRCHAIFVIASWPASRQRHWDILLQARAVENQLYIIGANRVGQGGGLVFNGSSAVIDPEGNTVARLGDERGLLVADIDPQKVDTVRQSLPFLKDRRFC